MASGAGTPGPPHQLSSSARCSGPPHPRPPGWSESVPSRKSTGRAGRATVTPRTPQTPPRSQVSRQGVEGLPGPGVSVPRAVHRPSRPSVPCHVVPVSLQALWLARHCLRALVGCPLLPAARRGPPRPHRGGLRQGAALALPVPLPAGSRPPLHRAWQSRGLLPTETVVAALAGPRHRYHPSLACRGRCARAPPFSAAVCLLGEGACSVRTSGCAPGPFPQTSPQP